MNLFGEESFGGFWQEFLDVFDCSLSALMAKTRRYFPTAQTRNRPRLKTACRAVPSDQKGKNLFPDCINLDGPVIAMMARFCAQDVAEGFPVSDVHVCPSSLVQLQEAFAVPSVGFPCIIVRICCP